MRSRLEAALAAEMMVGAKNCGVDKDGRDARTRIPVVREDVILILSYHFQEP